MFILGLAVLTEDIFTNVPPVKRTYSQVNIYGNCIIDGTHLLDYQMTDSDIKSQNTASAYNINTIVAGNFEGTLEAGALITGVGIDLNKYAIRRKEVGSSLNTLLTEITNITAHTYVDYTPKNIQSYEYTVTPVFQNLTDRLEGRGLVGSAVNVDFFGWILSDLTSATPVQYKFDIENESSDIEVVTDYKVYNNYTQFPAIRYGAMEHKKFKLKTVPYSYDNILNDYVIDKTVLNNIVDFINNKHVKLLRLTSGENVKVVTTGANYKYNDKIGEQPFTISFDMVEVGSA